MNTTIKQQFFYSHPPSAVWEYLTKPELISQWLMITDFEPLLGYDFHFTTKPIPSLNLDGIMHCKILEIVPNKKLSYSWKAGPGDGTISLDTIVVWTLVEKNNGTELQLVHSGFKEKENLSIFNGMTKGWADNMQKMSVRLNTAAHGTTQS